MGINTIIPQYRDSSISTMLRTNPDEIFEFVVDKDSLPATDTLINQISDAPRETITTPVIVAPVVTQSSTSNTISKDVIIDSVQSSSDGLADFNWEVFPSLRVDSGSVSMENNDPVVVANDTIIVVNDTIEIAPESDFHNSVVNREFLNNDWMTVVIIVILFVAGWIRLNFSKQLTQIIKGFFSFRQSTRLFNEQNSIQQNISGVMNVLFFLVTSVFISQLLEYYNYSFLGLNLLYSSLVVSIIYVGLIYLKAFMYNAIGYIFDNVSVTSEYIHNSFVVKKVLALVVLPLLIAIPFVSDSLSFLLIEIGFALYSLFYLLQILKGFQIIILRNQSIIYSFLYLCGLEIVPVLIILKIVSLFL